MGTVKTVNIMLSFRYGAHGVCNTVPVKGIGSVSYL